MPVTPRDPEIISEGTTMNNFDSAGNGLRGVLNRHENDITDLQADYTVKTAEISTLESQDETGWVAAGETWTYASATTFTVASDVTGKYQAGDKIKLTQTTNKYFYITNVSYSDPNTTITVDGQSTYTLANAAITSPYFSRSSLPFGFPVNFSYSQAWTSFTPTWTAVTTNPSIGNGTLRGSYVKIGRTVHFRIEMTAGSTTTFGSGAWQFALPVTAATVKLPHAMGTVYIEDAGLIAYMGQLRIGTTTKCDILHANTSGTPARGGNLTGTSLFTFAANDFIVATGTYEAAS